MYELIEETQTQTAFQETQSNGVDCILFLDSAFDDFGKKSYDIKICGEPMQNWVARSMPSNPIISSAPKDDNLLETLKPLLRNGEWTLVLFSDTPLVTSLGVGEILDYAKSNNLSVMQLSRGYVFKTEYLKNADALYFSRKYDICEKELVQVDTIDKLSKIQKILLGRIIKFHMKRGVLIENGDCTHIDCTVSIEPGVVIEPFVKLEGKTTVGANTKICSHTCISGSKIDENIIIKNGCNIVGSAVLDNAIVSNGCKILNKSVVSEDSIVSAGAVLDNASVGKNTKIGQNCTLVCAKVANNVTIAACAKLLGNEAQEVKVGSGANIGEGCTIFAGAHIKQDANIPPSTTVKVQ